MNFELKIKKYFLIIMYLTDIQDGVTLFFF